MKSYLFKSYHAILSCNLISSDPKSEKGF